MCGGGNRSGRSLSCGFGEPRRLPKHLTSHCMLRLAWALPMGDRQRGGAVPGRMQGRCENPVPGSQSCTLLPMDTLHPAALLWFGLRVLMVPASSRPPKKKGKWQNCNAKAS